MVKENFMIRKAKSCIRILTLALVLAMLLGCSIPVGVYAETVTPEPQSSEPVAQSTEPVAQSVGQIVQSTEPQAVVDDGKLRVLITSDIHYRYPSDDKLYYGVKNSDRVQLWVDSVNYEHENNGNFDLIIIAGDVSLDHYLQQGTYTTSNGQTSETDIFIKNYVSQLPDGVPVYIMPGNHEQYSNEQWKTLTGNDRQFSVEMEGNLFICLDNFNDNLEPNRTGNPSYTKSDVEFIEAEMSKYPNDKVWLIGHWIQESWESEEFNSLVRNDDRIKGLFAGHQHQCEVVDFCGKTLAKSGNFSISNFDSYPTGNDFEQDVINVTNSFWGFRELVITEDSAYSQYILADTGDLEPYYKESYAPEGVIIRNERRTIHKVVYDSMVSMKHWHFNTTATGYDVRFIGTVAVDDLKDYKNAGIEISIKLQGVNEYLLDTTYTTQNVYDRFVLGANVVEAGEGEQVYAVDMTGFKNGNIYEITFISFLTQTDGTVIYDLNGETTLTVENGKLL